jgi:4-carboxymuconolactone decarboxylase
MSLLDPAQRSARGLAIQAEVTGQPAPAPTTLLEESWRDFVFAEVWSRPELDRRARYLISLASAAMCNGQAGYLDGYVRGALASGTLSLAELREGALHLAVYGGWSRGAELDRAATRVAAELGLPPAQTAPIRADPWSAANMARRNSSRP